jgi:signal transduction histidine kinase
MEQRVSALLEHRSRISQDLHDSVLQSLYAIGLHLETSYRTAPGRSPDIERSHRLIVDQINQLIHEIRQMVHGLNQDTVPEFDLAEELRNMQATHEHIGLVRVTLNLEPAAIEVLTKEEEREILNIVREALSNCLRHAHAAHAKIAIHKRGEKIRVTVCDDGIGFATTAGSVKRGYGLANMEARARKIGGTLRVRSEPGHGTNITAEFSLEPILVPV